MKLNRSHKVALVALLAAQSFLADAQTNNAAAPVDYSTFAKFVANRNIFDPNRVPGRIWTNPPPRAYVRNPTPPPPKVTDSFSLVGIIGYGQGSMAGAYAFFDGSSPQFRKTSKLNASIATFKVADIAADSVTLVSGTNKMILGIGEQLKDDGTGHWVFADGTAGRYNTTSTYGNGGRNGYNNGGGRRRNGNNFGNGGNNNGNGNYNNGGGNNFNTGNNGNNFNRGRNNYAPNQSATDNSPAQDFGGMIPDGAFIPIVIAPPDNSGDPNSADQTDMTPPDNNQ
jgi:hypothetical protein